MFFRFLNGDRRCMSGGDRVIVTSADVKRLRFVTVSSKSKLGRANIFTRLFPSTPRLPPLVDVAELKTKSGKKGGKCRKKRRKSRCVSVKLFPLRLMTPAAAENVESQTEFSREKEEEESRDADG